ncbi:MAG TPA: RNA-binding protein [Ignisphaera sp.]|nr:RNA-binding protein [Ignisphaera sp.]
MTCKDPEVYVGKKFFMRYVLAVLYKFYIEKCNRVKLRALGKNISKAVKTATSLEYLAQELIVSNIDIGTVAFVSEGHIRYVSSIDIEISNKNFIP